ncbi:MAG: hypothetical protein RQ723_12095 [Desulfuromonadales bacterium]|nr:hypothetical protein [Desulfuromonadales bacterium]
MSKTSLSKSSFIKGLQCPKQLWFYKNCYDQRDPVSPQLDAVFRFGHEIGELATRLFPGGRMLCCDDLSQAEQVATTQRWIAEGATTIYEAAFSAQGVFARVDILHRGTAGWEIFEVKSATRVKPVFVQDLALQAWVLRQVGLTVSTAGLITLKCYQLPDPTDLARQFAIHDLTRDVDDLQAFVGLQIAGMQAMLSQSGPPPVEAGQQCVTPYRCSFHGYCHQNSEAKNDGQAA